MNWTSLCALAHGYFCHLTIKLFSLSFLSILRRNYFGRPEEKIFRPYQFFFPPLPLTKHPPKKFSFLFFLKFFIYLIPLPNKSHPYYWSYGGLISRTYLRNQEASTVGSSIIDKIGTNVWISQTSRWMLVVTAHVTLFLFHLLILLTLRPTRNWLAGYIRVCIYIYIYI